MTELDFNNEFGVFRENNLNESNKEFVENHVNIISLSQDLKKNLNVNNNMNNFNDYSRNNEKMKCASLANFVTINNKNNNVNNAGPNIQDYNNVNIKNNNEVNFTSNVNFDDDCDDRSANFVPVKSINLEKGNKSNMQQYNNNGYNSYNNGFKKANNNNNNYNNNNFRNDDEEDSVYYKKLMARKNKKNKEKYGEECEEESSNNSFNNFNKYKKNNENNVKNLNNNNNQYDKNVNVGFQKASDFGNKTGNGNVNGNRKPNYNNYNNNQNNQGVDFNNNDLSSNNNMENFANKNFNLNNTNNALNTNNIKEENQFNQNQNQNVINSNIANQNPFKVNNNLNNNENYQNKYNNNNTVKENNNPFNKENNRNKAVKIDNIEEEYLKERETFKKFNPPKSLNNNNNNNNNNTKINKKNTNYDSNTGMCGKKEKKDKNDDSSSDNEDPRVKGIDKKLVSFIEGEILQKPPNVKWSDIAGLDHAKDTINEVTVWPLKRPDLFRGIRRPPKGLLLFGPPGTGKTMIAKAIASESNSTFFNISASSLTSKWIGESEKLARALFSLASSMQPTVIFIDEIDSILCKRTENENESSRRLKTEFLVQLDGAGTNEDDAILIIGATNRPQEIDDAVIRRMSNRLYIPLPSFNSRKELFSKVILEESKRGNKYDINENNLIEISKLTKGYSGCDIKNVIREASMQPIRSIKSSVLFEMSIEDFRPVTVDDFLLAIKKVKASVPVKSLEQYDLWNKENGSFQIEEEDS